jgi:hypothetical protein
MCLGSAEIFTDRTWFLRLPAAVSDAGSAAIQSHRSQAAQFVTWCRQDGIRPASALRQDPTLLP